MEHDGLDWIREGLKRPGKTRAGLAAALGRQPSAVTALLNGSRELKAREIPIVAGYLGVDAPDNQAGASIPIMGRVGAGAEIEPDFEQVPPDGIDLIALPFTISDDMIAFEVLGDSMLPGVDEGDVIIVRREGIVDAGELSGRIAVVRTEDGHRYLKRVIAGEMQRVGFGLVPTFHLESINPGTGTIYNVRLAWASPVSFIAKSKEIRRLSRQGVFSDA